MNKLSLLLFFIVLFHHSKAQDKIISIKHDTIHCAIISLSNERIFYELKNKDGSVTGRFIPLSQVEEYTSTHQYGKYPKNRNQDTPKVVHSIQRPFRLGLRSGISTMPWYLDSYQSSTAIPDYIEKLKTGFHINADLHYMINSFMGLGAEYSFFETKTNGSSQIQSGTSMYITEYEKCRQYINYFGASVLFQEHPEDQPKLTLSASLSAGVLYFRMEDQFTSPSVSLSSYNDIANNVLFTGNNFSAKLGLSIEYKLSKAISVGLGGDLIWCTLKKASSELRGSDNTSYSADNKDLTNPMKLSRVDLSFVASYYF